LFGVEFKLFLKFVYYKLEYLLEGHRSEFPDSSEVALKLGDDLLVILTYFYVTDGFFQLIPSCSRFPSVYTHICNIRIMISTVGPDICPDHHKGYIRR
jgi:hypothetical protein